MTNCHTLKSCLDSSIKKYSLGMNDNLSKRVFHLKKTKLFNDST